MRYSLAVLALIMGISLPAFAALSPADLEKAYSNSYKLEKSGKFADAVKALEPVYKEYPAGYTINLRVGYLNSLSKQYLAALDNYNKASLAAPSALDPKLGKMLVLFALGKYSDAEQVGYQVINLDYASYLGNLRLVYALRMQQKNDLAEKFTTKMLAFYPVDTAFLAEYGILRYNVGYLDQAKRVFQDILIQEPTNLLAKDYIKLIDKIMTPSAVNATQKAVPSAVNATKKAVK